MRNNILAQSLQKSLEGSKAAAEAAPSSPAATADGPRSLRSMADVLSSVSAQAPQEIDPAEIADSEVADSCTTDERHDVCRPNHFGMP